MESSGWEPAAHQSLQDPLGYPKCTWGFQAWFSPFSALFHRGRKETSVILVAPTPSSRLALLLPFPGPRSSMQRGSLPSTPL